MSIDWQGVFTPTVGLLELIVRGSIMYLVIFVAMRVFRREAGSLSTADLIVVVLVADAAQNGMASDYESVTEGTVLVGTIFAWNYGLDWLAFRYEWAQRLLSPPPLLLIRNGRILHKNLRSEMLTVDNLMELLREHGIDDVSRVRVSHLESNGRLSVITSSNKVEADTKRKPGA